MPPTHKLISITAILMIVVSITAQNITSSTTPLFDPITARPSLSNSTNDKTLISAVTESSSEKPPDYNNNDDEILPTTTSIPPLENMPKDCSHRSKKKKQPTNLPTSRLRKCCPLGQSYVEKPNENGKENDTYLECNDKNLPFEPEIISATLYDNCIEDLEISTKLDIEVINPCSNGYAFNYGMPLDRFYILQDGSLLVMDQFSNQSYATFTEYCLDTNATDGEIYAKVCLLKTESLAANIVYTTMLISSMASLYWVSIVAFKTAKERRCMYNLIVAVMSLCLGIAFSLHTIVKISKAEVSTIGYIIQFFLLAYFFWVFILGFNIAAHICYILPNTCTMSFKRRSWVFQTYCLVAFSIPFALVLWAKSIDLPGKPYYFYQDITDEKVRKSQWYFIEPVTIVLLMCTVLLFVLFFGYKHLRTIKFMEKTYKPLNSIGPGIHYYDVGAYNEAKKFTKRFCCLYVVTIISWISVLWTFYNPGTDSFQTFMEIINNWQGLFILMIFVLSRQAKNGGVLSCLRASDSEGSKTPKSDEENSEFPAKRNGTIFSRLRRQPERSQTARRNEENIEENNQFLSSS